MTRHVRIIVRGVVQGVGFRMSTKWEADRLGLHGFIRNLADGSVEIVAEGRTEAVKQLIAWAKQGPPAAVVDDVNIEDSEPIGEFSDFAIRS